MAGLTVTVHLNGQDEVSVRNFPDGGSGPFISLDLSSDVAVLVRDPEILTALAAAAVEGRDRLTAAALAGQNRLPIDDDEAA